MAKMKVNKVNIKHQIPTSLDKGTERNQNKINPLNCLFTNIGEEQEHEI